MASSDEHQILIASQNHLIRDGPSPRFYYALSGVPDGTLGKWRDARERRTNTSPGHQVVNLLFDTKKLVQAHAMAFTH